jgi:glutamine---fructose-6-phosphate transaminase (isomerizing)
MCGIIGYTGNTAALPILLAGLEALEYRGYDSAGVSVGGQIVRSVGKVAVLKDKVLALPQSEAVAGIAHTRWATHGEPTEINAHPHTDASGQIHLVHNGIIENWRELRAGLEAQGMVFSSATDTEVLAKLIGHHYTGDLHAAVVAALALVRGAYGIVVWSADTPDTLVVARFGSPLILGITDTARYVASDPAALLPYTKRLIFLADGETAILTPLHHQVITPSGTISSGKEEEVSFDVEVAKKEGYRHFMEKEIFEASAVLENTLRGRVLPDHSGVKLGGLEAVASELSRLSALTIVGCGSASFAGQVGRLMLEEYAGLPTTVEIASEYRYRRQLAAASGGVLAITQSGETADTLASIKLAKSAGVLTLGIVNVVGSSIARETDAGVYNHAGPEVAVASTKAFLSQLTVMALYTVFIGTARGTLSHADQAAILADLVRLPDLAKRVLGHAAAIEAIAVKYKDMQHCMFIGRKWHAALASEGALKLKETTYIHAEGYPAGELKHGSIALLTKDFPVIALAPEDEVYEKVMSNVEEVKARQAPVILITTEGNRSASEVTRDVIEVPAVHSMLQPILTTIPLQLLAYYIGVARGLDVDKPRNLAKSVTVE